MRFMNQRGNVDPLIIPLIATILIAFGLAGFGVWSYSGYIDNRDNVDQKVAAAVETAEANQRTQLQADFDQQAKIPLKTYISPAAVGSITIKYPKTWSAYIEEEISSSQPFSAYFHPDCVPALRSDVALALRATLDDDNYADVLEGYDHDITSGELTVKPVKVAGVSGVRLTGTIDRDVQGVMVMFPLRDKTLKVWTESTSFLADFDNIILKKLSFSP